MYNMHADLHAFPFNCAFILDAASPFSGLIVVTFSLTLEYGFLRLRVCTVAFSPARSPSSCRVHTQHRLTTSIEMKERDSGRDDPRLSSAKWVKWKLHAVSADATHSYRVKNTRTDPRTHTWWRWEIVFIVFTEQSGLFLPLLVRRGMEE